MGNLIKSRLFELKRVNMLRILFFSMIAFLLVGILGASGNAETLEFDISTERGLTAFLSLLLVFVGVVVVFVCINDYQDRTINCLILNGYTRKQVYFSRVILSEVLGIVLFLIFGVILCVGLMKLSCPKEDSISISNMLVRLLLCVFPLFRIIGEIIFFSFIIKNLYAVEAAVVAIVMSLGVNAAFGTNNVFPLGVNSLLGMFHMVEYSTGRVSNQNMIYVVNSNFDIKNIVMMMVVSIVVGVFFIMLGYGFHKEDDYNGNIFVKGE